MRSGNTNEALKQMESRLDDEIIALSALVPEQADPKKQAGYIRALKRVREYRAAHPWKSDSPEVNQEVAEALASIPEQEGKN
jgi:hypothetical protein